MDFKIGSTDFRAEKLDLFVQFHVLRRLGGFYPNVLEALKTWKHDQVMSLGFISIALSRLPEDDANYIIRNCLAVVKVHQGDHVMAPIVAANGSVMFKELDLETMLHITWKVLEDNLGPFMRALLQKFLVLTESV